MMKKRRKICRVKKDDRDRNNGRAIKIDTSKDKKKKERWKKKTLSRTTRCKKEKWWNTKIESAL